MNTEAWDVFMTVSRDSGIVAAQCFEGPVRIVKCAVYLLFFAIVIICTFASKVSLLLMTTGAGDQKKVTLSFVVILSAEMSVVNHRPCVRGGCWAEHLYS